MKRIFSYSFIMASLLFASCDDGTIDHDDVYIPDPVEETDEDDGISLEPTTANIIRIKTADENRHQVIDGFGCAFAEWSHRIWNNNLREDVVEALFGKTGLNLNIFRGEVFPHYQDPETGAIEFWGANNGNYNLPANAPAMINNYWRSYHGHECGEQVQLGQMWLTDIIAKKYPHVRNIYSIWSPPASMKSNGSSSGGSLKEGCEQEYADYLLDFINEYEKKFGIKVYAISPSNEPNSGGTGWNGCSWKIDTKLAEFCAETLRNTLDNAGHQDVHIIYGEHSWWSGLSSVEKGIKNYDMKNKNIITAAHGYLTSDNSIKDSEIIREEGFHIWNTELSWTDTYDPSWKDAMKRANTFHRYFVNANLNALVWWAGARPCSNNESLIKLEEALPGTSYEITGRYYAYGQYSKHISVGSIRYDAEKEVTEGDEFALNDDVLVSSYINNETDTYTFVITNNSETKGFEAKLEVEGREFQNMISYTSDEGVKWQRKKINPSISGLRAVTIPKYSIVTVTGKLKPVE